MNKLIRESTMAVTNYNIRTSVVAFALALHRCFGFGETRIVRVLDKMHELVFECLSFEELREALLDETGLDVTYLEEKM